METSPLVDLVKNNIQMALNNDYSFSTYTDEELAGDLQAYAEDMEAFLLEDIIEAVKKVRAEGIAPYTGGDSVKAGS